MASGNETLVPAPSSPDRVTSPQELASRNGSPGSGGAPLALMRPSSAVVAAQRAQMGVVARAGQENAILTAVRKQMEALDGKLSDQMSRAQTQADKLRDAALSRYENKLSSIELNQPKLDRRAAELEGKLRGVSDEMQSQIRRIDATDSRLWEWRHQLEEEIRTKLSQIEANCEQITSTVRVQKATSDDMYKNYNQRLLKLETSMEERLHVAEDANQSIVQLHNRLTEMEEAECERARTTAIALHGGTEQARGLAAESALEVNNPTQKFELAAVDTKVDDLTRTLEALQDSYNDLFRRTESHDERYKTLRTLQDTKDEQYRNIGEKLEKENWDLKLKVLNERFQEMDKSRADHSELLEILSQKIAGTTQAHEELGNSMRRLQERSSDALALMAAGELDVGSPTSPYGLGGNAGVDDCLERLRDSEERIQQMGRELQILRSDQQVGTHVAALVNTLKDVAPKVISHDVALKELQELAPKVTSHEERLVQMTGEFAAKEQGVGLDNSEEILAKLESYEASLKDSTEAHEKGLDLCTSQYKAAGKSMEAIEARVGRLETEVSRLVDTVEGGDYDETGAAIAEDAEDEQDAEDVAPTFRQQRCASATE